jgi:magnesium and cobalt exporter, CNNM family
MIALRLFLILLLVTLNGFFSAVEFSLVAVRPSRVRQLADQGNPRARVVAELLTDLGRVVSGVQVGITLASLALGFIGEITLAQILDPLFRWLPGRVAAFGVHGLALILAFGLLTLVQVLLGELVPKNLGLQRAERVALLVARPFRWFLHNFRWAIDLLDEVAGRLVRLLGVVQPQSHGLVRSAEELQVLIQQARERGLLAPREERFLRSAMELGQTPVRALMVPRPDLHALPVNAGLEEVMRMFATTQRSRIPVYEGALDHVLGFVHIKDMTWMLLGRARVVEEDQPAPEFNLRTMLREVLIVPESKPASELLFEFRARRTGLAMVVDEFGSVQGLVTLEDLLEQMVGEIHDEFDVVEHPITLPDGAMLFDATVTLRDLSTQYNLPLPEDPAYETLGGFVLSRLGFIPRGGESFEADGMRFTVVEMDRRRVARVKVLRLKPAEPVPAKLPE